MLTQECTVETYRGDTAYGDNYTRPAVVQCSINDEARLVRGANGDEQLSQTTVLVFLSDAGRFALDSRVQVNGRRTFVIARNMRDSGGLGLGDHCEVNLK
jgi:hypothetical protein